MTDAEKTRLAQVSYGLLATTIHYKDQLKREAQDELVRSFGNGLIATSNTYSTPQICLHSLSVCMLELPASVMRLMTPILQQIVKINSATQISTHILEFGSGLSREHSLHVNFRASDYRLMFTAATNYIRFHNSAPETRRHSVGRAQQVDPAVLSETSLNQYAYVMAYQLIDAFYLSLSPAMKGETADHVILGLLVSNSSRDVLDEPSEVCLDMILQNYKKDSRAVLDQVVVLEKEDLGPVTERSWIQYSAIVTIRAQQNGPLAQIIVRSPSNISSRVINLPEEAAKKYAEFAERQVQSNAATGDTASMTTLVEPSSPPLPARQPGTTGPTPSSPSVVTHFPIKFGPAPCVAQEFISAYHGLQNIEAPQLLPMHHEPIARSLRLLDGSTSTIDAHKVSVLYVGPGQTTENEIMSNRQGSLAYWNFLHGLGNTTRLSGMKGFSAGLDTSGQDMDGRYTIKWRDLIAQLVFHVGTLMPSGEIGSQSMLRKKSLIGNDYVHIVFNESGSEYRFDTVSTQFNYVQIIVTPVDGRIPSHEDESMVQLYKVKTQVNPTVPFAGSATEPKLLTLTALPSFVRSIAIHAAILSNVHATFLNSVGVNNEFISPWRARLQSIKRMRGITERDAEKITPEVYSDDIPAPASESTDLSKATAAQVLDLLTKELEELRNRK
ncbi:hypothetical protein DL89DRAFT_226220 [Linderina pennispora]|uniref:Rap-GAP domain-containing protein n=1 Tax=Linderina pennispora TaxID=61395 RepID=A0A1Y1W105_9FUNG|nr:uncharacterized protein DL89DRAFT_226220 [Linderina pennispora]ORX67181.1 hypothetical protein DL89DRAFT_226220 [Linderina pennispora]